MNANPAPKRPDGEDELVHADDAIIGKAIRWSVALLAALAVLFGAAVIILKHKPAPPPSQVTQLAAPVAPERPRGQVPNAKFTDVTKESGLHFVHRNGAYGEKLLPETMGGGVAFFDYDNDGAQDLLLINSCDWAWHTASTMASSTFRR